MIYSKIIKKILVIPALALLLAGSQVYAQKAYVTGQDLIHGDTGLIQGVDPGAPGAKTVVNVPVVDIKLQDASCNTINTLGDLLNFASCIISKSVIPLIIILSVAVFLWGIVKFMMNTSDVAKRKEGKQFMIWGIVAIFVIVTYYGIVKFAQTTVGLKNSQIPIPQLSQ